MNTNQQWPQQSQQLQQKQQQQFQEEKFNQQENSNALPGTGVQRRA